MLFYIMKNQQMEHKASLLDHKEIWFDSNKYLDLQELQIKDRISKFSWRLYLEVWGHFSKDHHATRVLPWFRLDSKRSVLANFKDKCEILYCVNAKRLILNQKYSYEESDYIKQIKDEVTLIEKFMWQKPHIVINRIDVSNMFDKILEFEQEYQRRGYKVWERYNINWYPETPNKIFSEEWFGNDDHIPLTKNLVLVVWVEANSGKFSTCLWQIMMDAEIWLQSWYAKYETFPVWNLPVDHPVNLAYEAATADLWDALHIDDLHKTHYKIDSTIYNRDLEWFELLKYVWKNIVNHKNHINNYKSVTDMWINTIWSCITDDKVLCLAALEEIKRRQVWYKNSIEEWIKFQTAYDKTLELEKQAEEFCKQKGYIE